jgi:tRNA (guanine26-N2/guanine27-N2)-dimethyltransferase
MIPFVPHRGYSMIPQGLRPEKTSGRNSRSNGFTLFEALSATGLRSIRYAKELPLLKFVEIVLPLSLALCSCDWLDSWVLANDLSKSAVQNIVTNVEWNDLGTPKISQGLPDISSFDPNSKIHVNEGDCTYVKIFR